MADSLQVLAATKAARAGNWEQLKPALADVGKTNVPALMWFALPDGSYWSVEEGKSRETLATRPYFSKLLAGQRVAILKEEMDLDTNVIFYSFDAVPLQVPPAPV